MKIEISTDKFRIVYLVSFCLKIILHLVLPKIRDAVKEKAPTSYGQVNP